MTPHTQADYDQLLARFYGFCDSVIREVWVKFEVGAPNHVEVVLATRDSQRTENDGWVCVRIIVTGVKEVGFRDGPRTPIQVVSHGIGILCVEDRVGVDFAGMGELLTSLEDVRRSDGFAIGSQVEFCVEDYRRTARQIRRHVKHIVTHLHDNTNGLRSKKSGPKFLPFLGCGLLITSLTSSPW